MEIKVVSPEDFERFVAKVMDLLATRSGTGVVPVRFKTSDAAKYLGCGKDRLKEYIAKGRLHPFYDPQDLENGKPKPNATQWFYREELENIVPEEIRLRARIERSKT